VDQKFEAFCDGILDDLWRENPVEASYYGVHDYDDKLASYSRDAVSDYLSRRKGYLRDLESFRSSTQALTPYQEDNLTLLIDRFTVEERWFDDFEIHLKNPVLYIYMILDGLFIHTIKESLPIQRRLEHIEGRLMEIPRVIGEAKVNLSRGSKHVPPIWIEMAKEQAMAGLHFIGKSIPSFVREYTGKAGGLDRAVKTADQAISAFIRYLDDEISPRASGHFATGESMFKFLLSRRLRLTESPDDLLRMAENVAGKTDREMREIARDMKGTENWEEVVNELKLKHPPEDGVLAEYSNEVMKLVEFIREKDLVTIPDGEKLNIIETPIFMKNMIPYAAYIPPGPFEDDLNGYFLVTAPSKDLAEDKKMENLMGHNLCSIPVTSLHEGYPGHHLQIITSNLVSTGVRRLFDSDLFAEGWALYCEEMMNEMGYYTDPGTRLIQLKDLLWRACRVMIDVRLHTGDLDLEGAVNILVDVARLEKSNAIAEVKRYSMSPTQPLTYLTGKLEIIKLREKLKAREKGAFDLKAFHDHLLSFGTVPLDIVSNRMTS
jgi:uncharacterized protein (DUF885 family)